MEKTIDFFMFSYSSGWVAMGSYYLYKNCKKLTYFIFDLFGLVMNEDEIIEHQIESSEGLNLNTGKYQIVI